jgi:hypothetical protein
MCLIKKRAVDKRAEIKGRWSHSSDKKTDLDVNDERSSIKVVSGFYLTRKK